MVFVLASATHLVSRHNGIVSDILLSTEASNYFGLGFGALLNTGIGGGDGAVDWLLAKHAAAIA
jgi:hypothetical protein